MRRRIIMVFVLVCAVSLFAQIPRTINYQGKLTNASGVGLNGSYILTFRIYNSDTGGTALWSETHFSVEVTKGLFSVTLGTETALSISFDEEYWLEIAVNGEVLSPRVKLSSVPYAFHSTFADSVGHLSLDTLGAYLDTTNHFSNFSQDSINWDTLGAYWDTTHHFSGDFDTLGAYWDTTNHFLTESDLDTLGAYLDTTYTAESSYADSAGRLVNTLTPGAGITGEAYDGSSPKTWTVSLSSLADVDTAGVDSGNVLTFTPPASWTPSPLSTMTDSGNYIMNQDTSAQSANFWIDGFGVAKRITTDTMSYFPTTPRYGEFHAPSGTNELYWFDGSYWRRIVPPDTSYTAYGGPVNVTITVSDDSVCAGNPITLTANPSGGFEPYQYDWNTDGTGDWDDEQTITYSPGASGWITVQVKDSNDSTAVDSVMITADTCGSFVNVVGWVNTDKGYAVTGTNDGGALVAGVTNSFGAGGYDIFLLKFDSYGNLQWVKTSGTSDTEMPYSVIQTTDGGYAITGYRDVSEEGRNILAQKFDSLGNTEWVKEYNGTGNHDDCGYQIIQTSDGGYAITGIAALYNGCSSYHYRYHLFLMKFSSDGEREWTSYTVLDSFSSAYGYSLAQLPDNKYLVVGICGYGIIVKFNEYGGFIWGKRFLLSGHEFYGITVTFDGGYAISGNKILIKFNSADAVCWAESTDVYFRNNIVQTPDSGFAINRGDFVYKFTNSGSFEWGKDNYGSGYTDLYKNIALSLDGGILFAGYESNDVVISKIESDGTCCSCDTLSAVTVYSMASVPFTDFYPEKFIIENSDSSVTDGTFTPTENCQCGACE